MVTAEESSRPLPPGPGPSLRLISLLVLVFFGLAGIAWAVSDAITRHHNRVALRGLDGKPSPVALTVGEQPLVIPANLIRFPADRRGGQVTAVDLLLLWPSLDGFSEERAGDFRDGSPTAPLVYVTITEATSPLDSTARLADLYSRYFTGPPVDGPGNLVGRAMDADSAWRGEIVYFDPAGEQPYVVRCLAQETDLIPSTCIREVAIGHGLVMLYRFNRAWLADWATMDDRLRRLVNPFFRRA